MAQELLIRRSASNVTELLDAINKVISLDATNRVTAGGVAVHPSEILVHGVHGDLEVRLFEETLTDGSKVLNLQMY